MKISQVKGDSCSREEFSSTRVPVSTVITADRSLHIQKWADTLPVLLMQGWDSACGSQQNKLEQNWLLLDGLEVRCQSDFWYGTPLPPMWGI